MAKVTITAEDVLNAADYVTIETKQMMAELMTTFCVEERPSPNDGAVMPLPPVYRENRMTRQMFLMGVLAELYLKKKVKYQTVRYQSGKKTVEKPLHLLMDADEYNEWAGSHVLNQLDRMKKQKGEVADKVFDILEDYKLFEHMLLGAIRDEVSARNSEADRFAMTVELQNREAAFAAAKQATEKPQE